MLKQSVPLPPSGDSDDAAAAALVGTTSTAAGGPPYPWWVVRLASAAVPAAASGDAAVLRSSSGVPGVSAVYGVASACRVKARVIGVETDEHGLRLDALEQTLAGLEAEGHLGRVKLIYTVSEHSNPSGISLGVMAMRY